MSFIGLVHACVLSSFSRVQFFVILWTVTPQALLSMEFSRQEYWSRLLCSPPGHLPGPGIKPGSHALQVNSLPAELPGKPTYVVTDSQMIESEL